MVCYGYAEKPYIQSLIKNGQDQDIDPKYQME